MSGALTGASPIDTKTQARVLIPFVIVTLVWSSTWLVIRDQIGSVPPSWSVTYRFAVAAIGMFAVALIRRDPIRLKPADHLFAAAMGIAQFAINFNFIYRAEHHVTSGIVAVVFALLIVPNTLLARIFLGQAISRQFLIGSLVAIGGLAMLFLHETRSSVHGADAVMAGIGLTLAAVVFASSANVMQATDRAKSLPMTTVLAWGMFWGTLANAAWAWVTVGPPVFDARASYTLGVLYLGLFGSVLTFPLYFGVVRAIGPARAAYSSILIPLIAMTLSTIFESYRWTWEAAAGGSLTLFGLAIALRAPRPAR
jgi:drug/metabolite transporter (DMT)-like permease